MLDKLPPDHIIEEWLKREKQERERERPQIDLPLYPPQAPSTERASESPATPDKPERGVDTFQMW